MNDAAPRSEDRDALQTAFLAIVAIAAVAWFLQATSAVTMPLAFGFVLALLLYPVQNAVLARVPDRLKLLGPAAAMLTLILLLTLVGSFVWFAAHKVAEKAPDLQQIYEKAQEMSHRLGVPLPDMLGEENAVGPVVAANSQQIPGFIGQAGSAAVGVFASASRSLAIAVLIFFFTLLMLLEAKAWRARLAKAFGAHRTEALDAVDVAARKIREYLWVRTIVSIISGSLAALWFFIVGVELWYVWGFLFFAFNYIPFVGTLIAGIPPILMALVAGGWSAALLTLGGVVFTESIVENFIDPKLQGDRLSISPVVLLAGVAFLGWAWSWPGIFLAVPLTATLVVVLAHIEPLEPLAVLFSRSNSTAEFQSQTRTDPRLSAREA